MARARLKYLARTYILRITDYQGFPDARQRVRKYTVFKKLRCILLRDIHNKEKYRLFEIFNIRLFDRVNYSRLTELKAGFIFH